LFDPRASQYASRTGELKYWMMVRLCMLAAVIVLAAAVLGRT